ncbi:hypothetical protein FSB73_21225 [Arachidicoccus ginsenosidivorans]|uniref:GLAA-B beta-barrel domain-containing protein n=1 Tax=Arachidicoccus ginsenosidivorans TaxID=496057 RepID=A0A5B8VQW2_9BACT|nr:hypothetical protein [Arachidicoccus ginsenosidivorans]QEC73809.1 hypothetical protein FSB73_21225 [Arachidicoccus ginsenosidivorans]
MALYAQASHKREVIKAREYQIRPNTGQDQTVALQKVIRKIQAINHPVTLVFEPGQYDFYYKTATQAPYYISNTSGKEELDTEVKTIAILLKDIKGLTIEGNGALFMLHGKMTSLVADNCRDLTIHNLQFDYARPTMSEFTLTAVTNDYIDVKVNPDSWYRIKDSILYWYGENWDGEKTPPRLFTCVYTPVDSALHFVNAGWKRLTQAKRAAEIGENKVRFYQNKHTGDKLGGAVGDVYTVRDITRDEVGLFLLQSKNIRLDNVQMHFMHGLGIVSQFCTNLHFNHLRCAPRSQTDRICASTADMAHFSGCNGKITVENSFLAAHMMIRSISMVPI